MNNSYLMIGFMKLCVNSSEHGLDFFTRNLLMLLLSDVCRMLKCYLSLPFLLFSVQHLARLQFTVYNSSNSIPIFAQYMLARLCFVDLTQVCYS